MKNETECGQSEGFDEELKDSVTPSAFVTSTSNQRSSDGEGDNSPNKSYSTSRGVDESYLVGVNSDQLQLQPKHATNANQVTFMNATMVTSNLLSPASTSQPIEDFSNLLMAGGKADLLLNEDSFQQQQFRLSEDAPAFGGGFEDERISSTSNGTLFGTMQGPSLLVNGTGRQSLWQKPKNEKMFSIHNWNELQEKLKEEYNLIVAESAQKQKLQEELENNHLQYYRTYIELLELEEVSKESHKKQNREDVPKKKVLIENTYKLFKDADSFTKSILTSLAKNPKLLASIIKTQGVLDEATKSLTRTIVNTFYDNIIDEEVWDQDIMVFIANIIKFEVDQANTPSDIRFKSNQVLHKILNEFTKRQDFQRYTKYIFKGPLQYITKASKIIISPQLILDNLKKKQQTPSNSISTSGIRKSQPTSAGPTQSSQQNLGVSQSISQSSNQFGTTSYSAQNQTTTSNFGKTSSSGGSQIKNSASKYEQILRQYDSGVGASNTTNIISQNVMKIVGLGEVSKNARFHARQTTGTSGQARPSASSVSPMGNKKEKQMKSTTPDNRVPVDKQQTSSQSIEVSKIAGQQQQQESIQDKVSRALKKNIQTLRNLTNNVFDSVFKNLYNIPVPIRITCKIIEIITRAKFSDISESDLFTIIGYFLFDCYLIPQFMFSHHLRQVNLIKDEHEDNLFEVKKLMKNIYRRQHFSESKEEVQARYFNPLINELTPSIEAYFQELLSINDDAVHKIISHDSHSQNKMKVYCTCLTLENVQTLCSMIERNHAEIHKINPQVADNARRVMRINEDCKIFEDRKDLDIPGSHKPSQIYTILIDTNMPKDLQTNYEREYKQHYAVTKNMPPEITIMQKAKNMVLQVLVSIEKVSNILSFTGYSNMELVELFKIFEDGYYLHNAKHSNQVDNVPIMIKAKFLMNIIKQIPSRFQENNMGELFKEMNSEFTERFNKFMLVSNHTKSELLKARNTIKKYQSILKENIDLLNRDKKRRILYTFIENQPLHLCITSEKTRQGMRKKATTSTNQSNNQMNDEDDGVITICSTESCIHTQTNFDFVLGLTQGTSASDSSSAARKKELYESFHCKDIISFIDIFASLPEVQEVVTSGKNIPSINTKFSQFIEELFDVVKLNPLFAHYSLADQDWINNQLEKYITRKLYDQIFPKEKTYADTAMYCRMKVLSWIDYSHLEIEKSNRVDEMWDISAKALLNMDFVKSPSEKLDCLIESTTIMTDVLKLTQVNEGAASADSILPISIFILLKACPTRLWSNINFISAFCNKDKMLTQIGYCFAQIKLAVDFLANLIPKQVSLSHEVFHQHIYEKEMEFGIYFLKKRPRATRAPINKELVDKIVKDIEARKLAAASSLKPSESSDSIQILASFGNRQSSDGRSASTSMDLPILKVNQVFSMDLTSQTQDSLSIPLQTPIRSSTGSFSNRVPLESHPLTEAEQEKLTLRITNNKNFEKPHPSPRNNKS